MNEMNEKLNLTHEEEEKMKQQLEKKEEELIRLTMDETGESEPVNQKISGEELKKIIDQANNTAKIIEEHGVRDDGVPVKDFASTTIGEAPVVYPNGTRKVPAGYYPSGAKKYDILPARTNAKKEAKKKAKRKIAKASKAKNRKK